MKASERLSIAFQVPADSPEGIVLEYCRSYALTSSKEMIRKAITTFYLPLAMSRDGLGIVQTKDGSITDSGSNLQEIALRAINELEAQILKIKLTCGLGGLAERPRQLVEINTGLESAQISEAGKLADSTVQENRLLQKFNIFQD